MAPPGVDHAIALALRSTSRAARGWITTAISNSPQWEQRVGATYMISREISLIGQWHSDYGYGGGLTIRF